MRRLLSIVLTLALCACEEEPGPTGGGGCVPYDQLLRGTSIFPAVCPTYTTLGPILSPTPSSTNHARDDGLRVALFAGNTGESDVGGLVQGFVEAVTVTTSDGRVVELSNDYAYVGDGPDADVELRPVGPWPVDAMTLTSPNLAEPLRFGVASAVAPFVHSIVYALEQPSTPTRHATFTITFSEPLRVYRPDIELRRTDGAPVELALDGPAVESTTLTLALSEDAAAKVEGGYELAISTDVVAPRTGLPLRWDAPELGVDEARVGRFVEEIREGDAWLVARVGATAPLLEHTVVDVFAGR